MECNGWMNLDEVERRKGQFGGSNHLELDAQLWRSRIFIDIKSFLEKLLEEKLYMNEYNNV